MCVLTAVSVRRGYCAPHACGTTPVRWLSRHLSSQTQACGCADLCAVFLVSFLVRLLTLAEREALEDVPNTLAYQEAIETDAAAYLVRQWLMYSLYDRISTRPFLTEMEKLWISYQLVYALRAAHERGVAHGDLKCENVLVTSTLSVYVTDFASSFKPTYLPLDDPADFNLFFDTAGRRTCYVAPERFYESPDDVPRVEASSSGPPLDSDIDNVADVLTHEPYLELLGLRRPNGRITAAMDVFSLGCVLAELWRDGTPLFTLSQLFRYRAGQLDISGPLGEIPHARVRTLVARMVSRDPAKRPSLHEAALTDAFPPALASFFHLYLVDLQRSHERRGMRDEASLRWARALEPEERVEKLYEDWPSVTLFFEPHPPSAGAETVRLGVSIPGVKIPLDAPVLSSPSRDGLALLVLNVLLTNMRHCLRASSRCHALALIVHLAWGWMSDEACLDRILPYVVLLTEDADPRCRSAALQALVTVLSCTHSVPPSNAGVMHEFVLPNTAHLVNDECVRIRAAYMHALPALVSTALRFLALEHTRHSSFDGAWDAQTARVQDMAHEQLMRLVTDESVEVRRAALAHLGPLVRVLGRARVYSGGLVEHLLTFMNERSDWQLRAAVFPALEAIVPVAPTVQACIRPLLLQALGDGVDAVVATSLRALRALIAEQWLAHDTLGAAVQSAAALLSHPDVGVREASVGVVAAAAAQLPATDTWLWVYALARPSLECDIATLSESDMWMNLCPPIPRAVVQECVAAEAQGLGMATFWHIHAKQVQRDLEQRDVLARASIDGAIRPPTLPPVLTLTPMSDDDRAMLARLELLGLNIRRDAYRLAALWWHVEHVAAQSPRAPKRPDTSLADVRPRTVFFTPRTGTSSRVSTQAMRRAHALLEGLERDATSTSSMHSRRTSTVAGNVLVDERPAARRRPVSFVEGRPPPSIMEKYRTSSGASLRSMPSLGENNQLVRGTTRFPSISSSRPPSVMEVSDAFVDEVLSGTYRSRESEHGQGTQDVVCLPQGTRACHDTSPSTSLSTLHATKSPSSIASRPTGHPPCSSTPHRHATHSPTLLSTRTPSLLGLRDTTAPQTRTSLVNAQAERPAAERSIAATSSAPLDDSFGSTYDGADPYTQAHLEYVFYEQLIARTAIGVLRSVAMRTNVPPPCAKLATTPSNQRPQGTLIACLSEHTAAVTALAAALDATFFVSGSDDGTIRVWDTARLEKNVTARSRLTYAAHRAPITALLVLGGTHCVVSAARDGSVHAWGVMVQGGRSLPHYGRPQTLGRKCLEKHEYAVCIAQLSFGMSPVVVLGTSRGRLVVWDVRTMHALQTLSHPVAWGAVHSIAVDRERLWLSACTAHGILALWDLRFALCVRCWMNASHAPLRECIPHPTRPRSILVALEYRDGSSETLFCVLDLESGTVTDVFEVCSAGERVPQVSDNLLVPVDEPRTVPVHDAKRPQPLGPLSVVALTASNAGYTSTPRDKNGAPAGYVLSAGADRTIRFWDLGNAERNVAIGAARDGDFLYVNMCMHTNASHFASARSATQLHRHVAQAAPNMLAPVSPLHSQQQGKPQAGALARMHKDVITALAVLEAPYRCIVAADRSGAIRVWE